MTIMLPLPDDREFNTLMAIAKSAAASKLFPNSGNIDANFIKLMAARELRLPMHFALCGGIHVFDGKIELAAKTLNALIRSNGHRLEVIESNDQTCTIRGIRKDGDQLVVSFTIAEAQKAGLASKANWKNYAKDMLWARCISRISRQLFPDVVGMAYVEGEVIDVTPTESDASAPLPAVAPAPIPESKPTISLEKASQLEAELLLCPDEFVKTLRALCETHLGSSAFVGIEEKHFDNLMTRIKANQTKTTEETTNEID